MKHIPARPAARGGDTGASDSSKPLVLYVEDDPINHEVARARLAKKYQVLIAASDREACAISRQHAEAINVILMDIELQGSRLNGIDLTRLLRGTLPEDQRPSYALNVPTLAVPILFVTAYGARFGQAELIAAGGDAVLHKPIDFVQLMAAMTRTHLRRQGL